VQREGRVVRWLALALVGLGAASCLKSPEQQQPDCLKQGTCQCLQKSDCLDPALDCVSGVCTNLHPDAGGALGAHFLRKKHNWSAEVRFMHISNASIANLNPGINTIQVRLGLGLFSEK